MEFQRRYGIATTIYLPLIDFGATDFEATPVTFAAGDTQISLDGGAFANTTNNPVHEGNGFYSLTLTAAEMSAKYAAISIIDQTAPKLWEDQGIVVTTEPDAYRLMIADLVESHRPSHTFSNAGQVLYVSPNDGDTLANGADGSRGNPLNTVTEALSITVDSTHTVIILVPDAAAGATTLDEAVTVNKRYTFIRGPGRDFIWTTSSPGDTITVSADGCEISSCQINTHTTGSGSGVKVDGADFTLLQHLWINDTRGSGILLYDASHSRIFDCILESSGQSGSGHGIELDPAGGSVEFTEILRNHLYDAAGDGVRLDSGSITHVVIKDNLLHASAGYGVNNAGSATHVVLANNNYHGNASGETNGAVERINDRDIDTELTAAHGAGAWTTAVPPTAAAIADQVWDETAADHVVAGSMGELQNYTVAMTGAQAITVSITDAVPDPVLGVSISVYDETNTTLIFRAEDTDLDGTIVLNLDNGTYKLRLSRLNFTPDNAVETLVVVGDASVTYTGTQFVAPSAANPALCTVYGFVIDANGVAQDGEVISFLGAGPIGLSGNQITRHRINVTSGPTVTNPGWAAGYFEVDLVRLATVRVKSSKLELHDLVVTVPDSASSLLTNLTEAAK